MLCLPAAAGAIPTERSGALAQQPQQFEKLFLQICSQQEVSPERVIQGVATALDLPIRHITVVDMAEVDSISAALKFAQRRQHLRQQQHRSSWRWLLPDGNHKVGAQSSAGDVPSIAGCPQASLG